MSGSLFLTEAEKVLNPNYMAYLSSKLGSHILPVHRVHSANVSDLAAGAPQTVDGGSVSLEERILVAGQTDKSENGVYVVDVVGTGSNGSWTRAKDMEVGDILSPASIIVVHEGSTMADAVFKSTNLVNKTVGTDDIEFENIEPRQLGVPNIAGIENNAYLPFEIEIATSGAGSANVDVSVPVDCEVTDVRVVKLALTGGASDTVRIINGTGSDYITDAMSLNTVTAGGIVRPASLDQSHTALSAGDTLRGTFTEGTDDCQAKVTVVCKPL